MKLRAEKAKLLGFETHSDFILDARMAKTRTSVSTFLNDMVRTSFEVFVLYGEVHEMIN